MSNSDSGGNGLSEDTVQSDARVALKGFAEWLEENPHVPHAEHLIQQVLDADPMSPSTISLLASIHDELVANHAPKDDGKFYKALQLTRVAQKRA